MPCFPQNRFKCIAQCCQINQTTFLNRKAAAPLFTSCTTLANKTKKINLPLSTNSLQKETACRRSRTSIKSLLISMKNSSMLVCRIVHDVNEIGRTISYSQGPCKSRTLLPHHESPSQKKESLSQ